MRSHYIVDVRMMKYYFRSSQNKNFTLDSKPAIFMAVLPQCVSRQLLKSQSHKKPDMSKLNDKFSNCFQLVQLFLSIPSCLPTFVSKSMGEGGRGESRVTILTILSQQITFVY